MAERAELQERRSHACYLTDQNDAAVEAIEDALACRRRLGQRLEEGDSLRWLSQILWCPGRTVEAERAAREAVTLLEALPPGRELAMAGANLAQTHAAAGRHQEALRWAGRALELAQRLDATDIAVEALTTIGTCEFAQQGRGRSSAASTSRCEPGSPSRSGGRTSCWLPRRSGPAGTAL